jgi:SAM-dependent methyltransferase
MISTTNRYSDYDLFARIYNRPSKQTTKWEKILPLLETLLLQHLPEQAHIFDLCCGGGQLAQKLLAKGYQVTGLDGSQEMLKYARENAPKAKFILDDARSFKLSLSFDAVTSTSFALNHIMSLEELEAVFSNVYSVLQNNGLFVFDLRLEEWVEDWETSTIDAPIAEGYIKDDEIFCMRDIYNPEDKIGRKYITTFQLIKNQWHRLDFTLLFKIYFLAEIQTALAKVGFTEVQIYDLERDLGVDERAGHTVFVCRKSLNISS